MLDLVSILVPVFNREKLISETLESALSQTYPNIEVIVVDNASTDGTWQAIEEFARRDPRVKAFRNEANLGPVRNWLRVISEASGHYGKILWSDDLISDDYLEKTLPLFNPDVGFVYTAVQIFAGDRRDGPISYRLGKTGHYDCEEFIRRSLYEKDVPLSPGCAVFRLHDLRENLLLNIPNRVGSDFSKHAIGPDLLLFLLTCLKYKQVGFVASPLAFFRDHKGSISAAGDRGKLRLHYLLAKCYFVEAFMPEERARLAAFASLLLWKYPNAARMYGMRGVCSFFSAEVVPDNIFLAKHLAGLIISIPQRAFRKGVRLIAKIAGRLCMHVKIRSGRGGS